MKLYAVKCPECGATLDIDDGMKACFCKYCGHKILIDDEQQVITINQNINKNVHIERTKRSVNETQIAIEAYKDKQHKRDTFVVFSLFLILIIFMLALWLPDAIREKEAKSRGEVSIGYSSDLIGQDYKTVVAHFESAGFSNIEVIDLDDSGVRFWKDGKVENISVAGDYSFGSSDYFPPDSKVVISHH